MQKITTLFQTLLQYKAIEPTKESINCYQFNPGLSVFLNDDKIIWKIDDHVWSMEDQEINEMMVTPHKGNNNYYLLSSASNCQEAVVKEEPIDVCLNIPLSASSPCIIEQQIKKNKEDDETNQMVAVTQQQSSLTNEAISGTSMPVLSNRKESIVSKEERLQWFNETQSFFPLKAPLVVENRYDTHYLSIESQKSELTALVSYKFTVMKKSENGDLVDVGKYTGFESLRTSIYLKPLNVSMARRLYEKLQVYHIPTTSWRPLSDFLPSMGRRGTQKSAEKDVKMEEDTEEETENVSRKRPRDL
eukprot:TRINITY_DN10663_c0_g1_i1.p1 TRINITY_DN10663_c0_g1~~TRINITY_DN10663_c0_g1_i1.p1  ORF type:complete len:303 (+),score=68.89 TRINITY_DN10663_c0_g1_i1:149-1057(+)